MKVGVQSTFEASSDTKRGEKRPENSFDEDSDSEETMYAPNPFQGDGRKLEVKPQKKKGIVAQDEINLDDMIRAYQDSDERIVDLDDQLESLKA